MSEEEWQQWINGPLIIEKGDTIITRMLWAEDLFKEHIYPILKSEGFQLLGNQGKIIRKFLWFWRHLEMCGYNSSEPLSDPDSINLTRPLREYFDIFFNCFHSSYFNNLAKKLEASVGAFDDTYLGRRLLSDLPWFLWSNIDLTSSSQFIKHDKVSVEYDEAIRQIEESEMSIEELDRRRMKKNSNYDPDYVYDKHH